ncbi:unnamed protein product [Amoebophrya sp. A120]|nr:unnamed protein product [Amoebophrya sp. A120]|eukprot:GSA120T00025915001.1
MGHSPRTFLCLRALFWHWLTPSSVFLANTLTPATAPFTNARGIEPDNSRRREVYQADEDQHHLHHVDDTGQHLLSSEKLPSLGERIQNWFHKVGGESSSQVQHPAPTVTASAPEVQHVISSSPSTTSREARGSAKTNPHQQQRRVKNSAASRGQAAAFLAKSSQARSSASSRPKVAQDELVHQQLRRGGRGKIRGTGRSSSNLRNNKRNRHDFRALARSQRKAAARHLQSSKSHHGHRVKQGLNLVSTAAKKSFQKGTTDQKTSKLNKSSISRRVRRNRQSPEGESEQEDKNKDSDDSDERSGGATPGSENDKANSSGASNPPSVQQQPESEDVDSADVEESGETADGDNTLGAGKIEKSGEKTTNADVAGRDDDDDDEASPYSDSQGREELGDSAENEDEKDEDEENEDEEIEKLSYIPPVIIPDLEVHDNHAPSFPEMYGDLYPNWIPVLKEFEKRKSSAFETLQMEINSATSVFTALAKVRIIADRLFAHSDASIDVKNITDANIDDKVDDYDVDEFSVALNKLDSAVVVHTLSLNKLQTAIAAEGLTRAKNRMDLWLETWSLDMKHAVKKLTGFRALILKWLLCSGGGGGEKHLQNNDECGEMKKKADELLKETTEAWSNLLESETENYFSLGVNSGMLGLDAFLTEGDSCPDCSTDSTTANGNGNGGEENGNDEGTRSTSSSEQDAAESESTKVEDDEDDDKTSTSGNGPLEKKEDGE